jgi:hypothetical protein
MDEFDDVDLGSSFDDQQFETSSDGDMDCGSTTSEELSDDAAVTPAETPFPSTVAPIPGTDSGVGVATSWDASGRPTHVTYGGVVNPPTTDVTMGGNSPLYDGAGHSMTGAVQDDPTHVTLDYVPQQVAPTDPPPPQVDPYSPAGVTMAQERAQQSQTATDTNTRVIEGVTPDRSTGTYYANGKPFDDYGDALGEARHPTTP